MDGDLISKKELLDLTGISYGQLYRWKRKRLIPDEWFIRKSTFTGQETFFPRPEILERVGRISGMKEDLSLDELASVFSPDLTCVTFDRADLIRRNIVTPLILQWADDQFGDNVVFTLELTLYAHVLEIALRSGEIGRDEGALVLQTLREHFPKFAGRNCDLIVARKLGVPFVWLASAPVELYPDQGSRIVLRLNLAQAIENLKIHLNIGRTNENGTGNQG